MRKYRFLNFILIGFELSFKAFIKDFGVKDIARSWVIAYKLTLGNQGG